MLRSGSWDVGTTEVGSHPRLVGEVGGPLVSQEEQAVTRGRGGARVGVVFLHVGGLQRQVGGLGEFWL